MSEEKRTTQSRAWKRKPPERTRPDRRAGGFYRGADAPDKPAEGGMPLTGIDAAVQAAVRMGYKVAEAQIERSARLAQRLREGGEGGSKDGGGKSTDATEQLIVRALIGGLGLLEGAASDPDSPLKRLAEAEYKLMGSMFGLSESGDGEPSAANARPALEVRHAGADRRPVRVTRCELAGTARLRKPVKVSFYSVEHADAPPLAAEFATGPRGTTTLTLATPRKAPSGTWRGAICTVAGVQLGVIEFLL